jgi:hypothetical protein
MIWDERCLDHSRLGTNRSVTGKILIRSRSGEINDHDVFILAISPPFKPRRCTISPITFTKVTFNRQVPNNSPYFNHSVQFCFKSSKCSKKKSSLFINLYLP